MNTLSIRGASDTPAMKTDILVRRPDDLTTGWAQRVVDLHQPGVTVSSASVLSVDVGTTTRVRLAIEHDGPPNLPRRWFVKLPSLNWRARLITALPRLLHTEARFYNEAAHAIPVAMPPVLAARSRLGRGAVIVLADITESGGVPGTPGDTLTVAQAEQVIRQLARLHAHFQKDANLLKTYRWLTDSVRQLEDYLGTALALPLMQRGLHRAGSLVPAFLHAPALRYARRRRRVMRFLAQAPQTLVHHDCHPGNLFWYRAQPGLLDWQLVRIGDGIGDVAYFLATALRPEDRRCRETDLVAAYADALHHHGAAIDTKRLMNRYRAHLTYPFEAMILSLAVGSMIAPESNRELIRRTAAAVADLDAFSTLPA